MTRAPEREGATLCLRCGLCCSGAVFTTVPLDDDEAENARRLRLPVIADGPRTSFRLPCPHLDENACAIYDERPHVCRGFVCRTLAAYLAHDIDLPEAEARVERLRAAAARVAAQLPPELAGRGLREATALFSDQGEAAPDRAAWRALHGPLLLDLFELEKLCRRDFGPDDDATRSPAGG